MMIRSVCAWACLFAGAGVFGDVYVWTNNVSTTPKWTNQANWNVNGAIPAQSPTNGAHTVQFGPLAFDGRQEVGIDVPSDMTAGSTYAFALSEIAEDVPASRRTISLRNTFVSLKETGFSVSVGALADFTGYWCSLYGRALFNLTDGDTLSNLAANRRAQVSVPSAATATLNTLYTEGVLEKKGAGELTVKATQGADNLLVVSEGTLALAGRPDALDAGDDLPVPGAWLHLDASRSETLLTRTGEDGRTYVTNWCDVRKNGVYAWFDPSWSRGSRTYLSAHSSAPFLNTAFVPGHTVVDFGRIIESQDEALGPVGCWLKLSQTQSKVREVFYAGCYSKDDDNGKNYRSSIIPGVWEDGCYHFHRGSTLLFSATYASPGLVYGDVLVNNVPESNKWIPRSSFHVFSAGATNDVRVAALATDRMYKERVGDARVGEFILFTNALTHAERVMIQTHLMRKWGVKLVSTENQDAGAAVLATDTAALSVPANRTAAVGEVTAGGGTLVKKGAGHLDVGVVAVPATGTVATPSLDVQGGDVTLAGVAQPTADDEPAADAWLWLDAAAADSFVFTNKADDATAYVACWNDRRSSQTQIFAELATTQQKDYAAGNFPARLPNVVGTLPVVDFGPYGQRDDGACYLKLNAAGYQKSEVYEAFVVMRHKDAARSLPVFGSSASIRFYRSSVQRLLQGSYGYYDTQNALWTIDGVPVDPLADGQGKFEADRFYVVSVALCEKVYVDLVGCKDRVGQGTSFGGAQVGEQILYSRRLSPAERRQTIAYLMKKWQGRTPAFAAAQAFSKVSYAADVPAVLDTAVDVGVVTLSGGDGTFVKKGAGTLSVSALDLASGATLSVREGRAEVTLDFITDAAFHFDASDFDALTYYVTDDGARTNVTSVADVRRNGVCANAWINNPSVKKEVDKTTTPWTTNYVNRAVTFTNPVWRVVEAAPGVLRPTFDFGRMSGYYSSKYDSSSAFTMNVSFRTNTVPGMGIREAYAVFANDAYGAGGTVFGHTSDHHYMSANTTLFNGKYVAPCVKEGYIALDGEEVTYDHAYPAKNTGLHVLAVKPTGPTSINAMGCERNIYAGGNYISEFIGFTNELTAAQRTCLQQYLRYKWTETGTLPLFPKAFASLEVASGATLVLQSAMAVSVAKISGAGSVTGAKVRDVAEIEVACANGTTQPATFASDVTFASAAEVVLTGETAALTAGDHILLNAGALAAEGVAWSVTGVNRRKWVPRVIAADGKLVLRLAYKGTAVWMR